jgi:hypothetical protein
MDLRDINVKRTFMQDARRTRDASLSPVAATSERAPLLVLVLSLFITAITLETLLYPSQNSVPTGPFSLSVGGFNFRLVDGLVLVTSIMSIFFLHRGSRLLGHYYLILGLCVAYLSIAAAIGYANGVGLGVIFSQSRFLLYLVCLVPLTLAATPHDVLRAGASSLKILGVPILAAGIMSYLHSTPLQIPGFSGSAFGDAGGDIGTIVGVLALCQIGLRAEVGRASWAVLWMLLPLLISQRASILTTTVIGLLAVLGLWYRSGVFGTKGQRRLAPSVVIAACAFSAIFATIIITGAIQETIDSAIGNITGTFTSEGKQASADTRPMQLNYAWDLFQDRPFEGHGLGQSVQFYDVYRGRFVATESAHNFLADLLVRGGVVGLALAAILFWSAVAGRKSWSPAKIVWVTVLAIVVGKGLVEPALDKYRLVFFVALALSCVVSERYRDQPSHLGGSSRPINVG